jgi:hypothetical protein
LLLTVPLPTMLPARRRSGLGDVRDQLAEVEGHLGACVGVADLPAIPVALDGQVQPAALPRGAHLVRRDRQRSERGRGLALQEAEALGQFGGYEIAQAPVVDQHQQAHALQRAVGRGADGHVAGDDGHFRLEVDAPLGAGERRIVLRAQEVVAAALVHQRVFVEARRHFRVARPADEFDVVQVRRSVHPLVGTRQRSHALLRVEGKGMPRLAAVERRVQVFQLWRDEVPVVEQALHRRGDAGRKVRAGPVTRNDGQLAVA